MENSLAISQKDNIDLPYDPAITFLKTCPRDLETEGHIRIHTQMFIVTCFTIARK